MDGPRFGVALRRRDEPALVAVEREGITDSPELVVFALRSSATDVISEAPVRALLRRLGFEILLTTDVPADVDDGRRCLGVDGAVHGGIGAEGAGRAARLIVALQYGWRPPTDEQRRWYPRLGNGYVFDARERLQTAVDVRRRPEPVCQAVEASESEEQAWCYLRTVMPQSEEALHTLVIDRRRAFRTDEPVVAVLSRGRRAKVEVVQRDGREVVKKTFAPQARRFMERELEAMDSLRPHLRAVPEVLEGGDTWFTMPRYVDRLRPLVLDRGRLLPLPLLEAMVDVLRVAHRRGWAIIDAQPHNFVVDSRHGLKLLDYEFAYHDMEQPPFADSYSIVGKPDDRDLDLPVGRLDYDATWRPWTGLSRRSLLERGRPWQDVERGLYVLQRRVRHGLADLRALAGAGARRHGAQGA